MDAHLQQLLRATSRSFHLSLVLLPRATRGAIGLAYLLARTIDTVADAALVPLERRLERLEALAESFAGPNAAGPSAALIDAIRRDLVPAGAGAEVAGAHDPAERALLERFGDAVDLFGRLEVGDRARVAHVIETIARGMVLDLRWFPAAEQRRDDPVALSGCEDLWRYCFHVAGSVGGFWTAMHLAHGWSPSRASAARAMALGERFGEALQLTNIVRDLPRDLDRGRCYVPDELLAPLGLTPGALREPACWASARPAVAALLVRARQGYRAAVAYLDMLPASGWPRLRLATALPLLIGLRTLVRLGAAASPLDASVVIKVPRREVYRLLVDAGARAGTQSGMRALCRRHLREVDAAWRRVGWIGAAQETP